jgi:hypothetical protein
MGPVTYQLYFKRIPRFKILQIKLEFKLEFKSVKQKIEKENYDRKREKLTWTKAHQRGLASWPVKSLAWIPFRYPTDRRDPPVRRGMPSSSSSLGQQSDDELHVLAVFEDRR